VKRMDFFSRCYCPVSVDMPNDRVLDVIRISEIILETMLMHALTEQTNVWHRSLKPNFAKRSFLEDDYQSGARICIVLRCSKRARDGYAESDEWHGHRMMSTKTMNAFFGLEHTIHKSVAVWTDEVTSMTLTRFHQTHRPTRPRYIEESMLMF
jgi:hypothetical protein